MMMTTVMMRAVGRRVRSAATTMSTPVNHARLRRSVRDAGVWFVDVPRTGSTSLKVELSRAFGRAYGKTNVVESALSTPQLLPDHLSAREVREVLGRELWHQVFSFGFVRDPWSRTASMYRWRRLKAHFPPDLTFPMYVQRLAQHDPQLFAKNIHWAPCAAYLTDAQGGLLVDRVCRFETRSADLDELSRQLGDVPLGEVSTQQGDLNVDTPMDEQTIDLISNIYAVDVDLFDYSPPRPS